MHNSESILDYVDTEIYSNRRKLIHSADLTLLYYSYELSHVDFSKAI